jgi:hypothetical protein
MSQKNENRTRQQLQPPPVDERVHSERAILRRKVARGRNSEGKYSFALKHALDVSFAVQDTNNVHGLFLESVVNPNGFKSSDRP